MGAVARLNSQMSLAAVHHGADDEALADQPLAVEEIDEAAQAADLIGIEGEAPVPQPQHRHLGPSETDAEP